MDKRNISISSKNGYTFDKVMLAKQYLDEIGNGKRHFPFERLVQMYNDVLGRNEKPTGCKCQSPKYYNGIMNYYRYGKLTLITNGLATEADFEKTNEERLEEAIENAENRLVGVVEESVVQEEEEEQPVEEEEKPVVRKKGRPRKNVEEEV